MACWLKINSAIGKVSSRAFQWYMSRAPNYESITSNHAIHSKLVVTGNTIEDKAKIFQFVSQLSNIFSVLANSFFPNGNLKTGLSAQKSCMLTITPRRCTYCMHDLIPVSLTVPDGLAVKAFSRKTQGPGFKAPTSQQNIF